MFEALDQANAHIVAARNDPDPAVRDSVRGKRTQSPATYPRIRATLSTAMTTAVSEELAVTNPVRGYKIPKGARAKARIWTPNASPPGANAAISPARSWSGPSSRPGSSSTTSPTTRSTPCSTSSPCAACAEAKPSACATPTSTSPATA
ncbi:hypothetical protein ACFQY4_05305 [Catellatospora bangladeshensis]|uniref:hypothetical protein n=1 Tax=Catellatospora bangladeshensis TaxID=310355 RepID=UPI0036096C5C